MIGCHAGRTARRAAGDRPRPRGRSGRRRQRLAVHARRALLLDRAGHFLRTLRGGLLPPAERIGFKAIGVGAAACRSRRNRGEQGEAKQTERAAWLGDATHRFSHSYATHKRAVNRARVNKLLKTLSTLTETCGFSVKLLGTDRGVAAIQPRQSSLKAPSPFPAGAARNARQSAFPARCRPAVLAMRTRCCAPCCGPSGKIMIPPSASCWTSGCGTVSAAAVTMMRSIGRVAEVAGKAVAEQHLDIVVAERLEPACARHRPACDSARSRTPRGRAATAPPPDSPSRCRPRARGGSTSPAAARSCRRRRRAG